MGHRDERLLQGVISRDPTVSIEVQQPFQEVHKGESISALGRPSIRIELGWKKKIRKGKCLPFISCNHRPSEGDSQVQSQLGQ